jgi:hypothetical protein
MRKMIERSGTVSRSRTLCFWYDGVASTIGITDCATSRTAW